MTPADFCATHNACDEGREWAIATEPPNAKITGPGEDHAKQ
jgi:hypothetical protein